MRELRVRIRKSISPEIDRLERQSLELIERTRVARLFDRGSSLLRYFQRIDHLSVTGSRRTFRLHGMF